MSQAMPGARIFPVSRLELGFAPYCWAFAQARRAEIEAHFAKRRATTPALWNGRVLLMREPAIAGGTLRGTFFETGFAEFTAWCDWGWPDRAVFNGFAMAVLRAADGGYLMGVMGAHTVGAGKIYFPAGTPDPSDLRGDSVDLLASVTREIAEETGLTAQDFAAAPGWDAVFAGPYIAMMKAIAVPLPAEEVRQKILRHLVREVQPELADMRIVRSPRDFDPMMPPFVTDYLSHLWGAP
jgi:8-oxo-dGTP pyrophosphatase MutT (NUDIX family)